MGWYPLYLIGVFILWGISSPRDRNSLRILLLSGVGAFLLTKGISGVHAPWKLIVPATVESLTIVALLHFSPNRTAFMQVGLLAIAWASHLTCYFDLMTGSNVVYDNYERILFGVGVCQLVACYDSIRFQWNSLTSLWVGRGGDFHPSGRVASVLHNPSGKSL